MTAHDDPEAEAAPDAPSAADALEAQAFELASLHQELIKSYEKELVFFSNLEKRDRQARAKDNARLKKIWWLESELRRQQAELDRTRSALRNLQLSPMGRLQRWYWKMRQGARR